MFEKLFDWARHGHEKTLNQRVRPGLIIILNKNTESAHEALQNPETATQEMLQKFQSSSRFRELQQNWRNRGRQVKTAKDLIHCYYYAFRVISIPSYTKASPPMATQIATAIQALYKKVCEMSQCIRDKREKCNMDLDVSSFSSYMEYAAKKLARDYKCAIDFHHMELSSGNSRLPKRFSEHLVQLMRNMAKTRKLDVTNETKGESQMVEDLIPFIASCIVAQVPHPNSSKSSTDSLRRFGLLK
jgi:hypothetical protein